MQRISWMLGLTLCLAACAGEKDPQPADTDTVEPETPTDTDLPSETDSPTDDETDTTPDDTDVEPAISFSAIQPALAQSCGNSYCHGGGQVPNLNDGGYDAIVGVRAEQLAMPYIDPMYPDTSYLLYKIKGTQTDVGGGGQQMPRGGSALPQEVVDQVEAWILAGAPE
jgi:hypothetical protein